MLPGPTFDPISFTHTKQNVMQKLFCSQPFLIACTLLLAFTDITTLCAQNNAVVFTAQKSLSDTTTASTPVRTKPADVPDRDLLPEDYKVRKMDIGQLEADRCLQKLNDLGEDFIVNPTDFEFQRDLLMPEEFQMEWMDGKHKAARLYLQKMHDLGEDFLFNPSAQKQP